MSDMTIITYGEGGFDDTKPENNIVKSVDVVLDANGEVASETVTFEAS